MQNLAEKFFKPGKLVVDPFSGAFATTKASLETLRHRRFVGYVLEANNFPAYTEMQAETYVRQVLSDMSEILRTG